jgi:hypothetical protein
MGMGMGAGRIRTAEGMSPRHWESQPRLERADEQGSHDDIVFLKQRAEALAEELAKIQQSIERMEKK